MRPLQPLVLCLCAVAAAGAGCASPVEQRQELIALDGQWRLGEMEKDSFERMIAAVHGLGLQESGDEKRLAAVADLLRVVLKNPSSLVRAEALRSAWKLGAGLPAEPFRADTVDQADFNARTQRLELLINEADASATGAPAEPGAARTGIIYPPEALELATWLAHFHAPAEAPAIAVSVSEVVLSQALFRDDALGAAFRAGMASSLDHALVCATLHAAADPYPVVREEALRSARHLHPENALALVGGVLARESDSAVVLAALDSLDALAGELPAAQLHEAVEPLASSTDVAVKRRIADLLAQHPG